MSTTSTLADFCFIFVLKLFLSQSSSLWEYFPTYLTGRTTSTYLPGIVLFSLRCFILVLFLSLSSIH